MDIGESTYRIDSQQDLADRAETIRYLVEYYHDKNYWHDNNSTHATKLEDCTDPACIENKELL
jgi:hypothetical protein